MWLSIANAWLNRRVRHQIESAGQDNMTVDPLAADGWAYVLDHFRGGYAQGFDRDREYEFMRHEWCVPSRFRLADQHPGFNIAGLYYREPQPGFTELQ